MKNRATCVICGESFPYECMEHFNTGRRVQHICQECYKSGDIDARIREVMRGDRARKGWKK